MSPAPPAPPPAAPPSGTRETLLRAAAVLVERDGREAVTLRALGAAAGVSRGAAYRHFADKDALLAAVATRGMRALREAMTAAGRHAAVRHDPVRRLEAVLVAYVDAAGRHPAHYRLIYGRTLNRRDHPELKAEGAAAYAVLLQAVRDGQAAGALAPLAPAVPLADVLWSAVHGLVDLTLSAPTIAERGPGDPRRLIRLLLDQLSAPRTATGR